MLISIIIPFKERIPFLLETIRSIRGQVHENWECILVDDGSSPESLQLILKVIKDDLRFQLHAKASGIKSGACASRNYGASLAKGEGIIFFDSDDILMPEALVIREKALESAREMRESFVISPALKFNDRPENAENFFSFPYKTMRSDLERFLRHEIPWTTGSYTWLKAEWERNPVKWDEKLNGFQDFMLSTQTLLSGIHYSRIYEADWYYREGDYQKISTRGTHTEESLDRVMELCLTITNSDGFKNADRAAQKMFKQVFYNFMINYKGVRKSCKFGFIDTRRDCYKNFFWSQTAFSRIPMLSRLMKKLYDRGL